VSGIRAGLGWPWARRAPCQPEPIVGMHMHVFLQKLPLIPSKSIYGLGRSFVYTKHIILGRDPLVENIEEEKIRNSCQLCRGPPAGAFTKTPPPPRAHRASNSDPLRAASPIFLSSLSLSLSPMASIDGAAPAATAGSLFPLLSFHSLPVPDAALALQPPSPPSRSFLSLPLPSFSLSPSGAPGGRPLFFCILP
jgi:hypothetical protein